MPYRLSHPKPLKIQAPFTTFLANKTQAAQAYIKYKQWIYRKSYPISNNSGSTENAYSGGQRPQQQNYVDWYPGDAWKSNGAEHCGNNQGK